ncbi:MAG: hypothetical protein Q8906_12290 [Bacillota bacterium]|nr:hypothetical protein [Bacillota bacterium]
MLRKLLPGVLILSLAIPTLAFAEVGGNEQNKHQNMEHRHHQNGKHHHCHEMMQAKEKKLLSLVDKYTPNQRAQWNQALKERKTLFKQMSSPEFKAKREQFWKAKKAEVSELRKQLKEGKITKEEFMQKMQEKKQNFHAQKQKYRIAQRELKNAVKNNDSQMAAKWLNELLAQLQQHNQWMKDRMSK